MDRRKALKTLGAGGAVVAGTSLIISSPAFAFDAPSVPANTPPTTFTLTKTSATTATIEASGFQGTCPASASPGSPTTSVASVEWRIGSNSFPADPESGSGETVTKSVAWLTGDAVSVELFVDYTCTYQTGSSSASYRWQAEFQSLGNDADSPAFNLVGSVAGPSLV